MGGAASKAHSSSVSRRSGDEGEYSVVTVPMTRDTTTGPDVSQSRLVLKVLLLRRVAMI